ncbi:hypothetical protein AALO_G00213160 [Alosa alosa]|uniref:Chemokine interleukin-8-like domain-containing protein n=1 Tax=Alosa alosa TaxID=278164 RepID=A0AAV6G4S3_9TELE|nr:hypothetical protein AALO_G00213160 [Alosa alosa]
MALHQMIILFCLPTILFSCIQGETVTFSLSGPSLESKENNSSIYGNKTFRVDPKPISCCKKVSPVCSFDEKEITRCIKTLEKDGCVRAVIFFSSDESRDPCCVPPQALWVHKKMTELAQKGKPCEDDSKPIPNAML